MRHVVIFARRPRLGQIKRRLAADIGPVETLRFYRSTLDTVTRRLLLGQGWSTRLAVTPDDAAFDSRAFPPGVQCMPQGNGDLGERMARCLTRFGPNPAIIIGSDIPGIERRHIAAAFDALRRNDLVFGPSDDGGYWLVGAAQGARVGGLFEDVRWSTEQALVDTLENIRPGVRVEILEMLADIDTGATYYARRQSRWV